MSTLLEIAKHKGITIQKIVAHVKESFGFDVPCSAGAFVPDNIARLIVPTISNKSKQSVPTPTNSRQPERTSRSKSQKSRTITPSSLKSRGGRMELRLINSDKEEMVGVAENVFSHSIFLKFLDGGHFEAHLQDASDATKIEIGDIVCIEPVEDEDSEETKFCWCTQFP